jgi:phosphonate transport system substrate-binding protein
MKRLTLAAALLLALSLAGCGPADKTTAGGKGTDSGETLKPTTLNIALVPSDDTEEMLSQFEKLRAYLEQEIKLPVKVQKVTSYAAVIEAMKHKRIEVAWFGPASYVLAEEEANAEPFAVSVDSKGSSTYVSEIILPPTSPIKDIKELGKKKLALVEPASTSGGLVPSYMIFQATGQPADKFCNVSYVQSHDTVVNVVKAGSVDAGATNNLTIDRMLSENKLKDTDFKVLAKSDPIPGSPLCFRKDLDPKIKDALWNALQKSPQVLGTYKIAGQGEIAGFKRIGAADYQVIRDIRQKLNVSRDTLLK